MGPRQNAAAVVAASSAEAGGPNALASLGGVDGGGNISYGSNLVLGIVVELVIVAKL